MAYAPTITTFYDDTERAEVLFTAFAAGTVKVDVYREAEGRSGEIQGGMKAAVSGALSRIDWTIPFGTPVTYWAKMWDAAGLSLGLTDRTTTTHHSTRSMVHHPLDPKGAVRFEFQASAARQLVRPTSGEVVHPLGRTVGVVISGQRQGLRGVNLDIVVDSTEDADKLQKMLGGYGSRVTPVLCFRIGSLDRVRLPKPFFGSVLEMSEEDMTYVLGGTTIAFKIRSDEVSPPTPALVVPLLTRADLNAFYPTRAALNADHISRLEVNRHYSLSGTADA